MSRGSWKERMQNAQHNAGP
ncbi:hypothetical protein VULLAG_LOCUS16163 [Vulpes lagopus]